MQVEKVTQYIISWLKEYASNAGVKGFVIGVSGGIDSAVTSTLCAKTGFPTLCLEMPIHQEKNQVNRATRHISFLKDRFNIWLLAYRFHLKLLCIIFKKTHLPAIH